MRFDVELTQLEHFVAVARARNITRASADLNLSQSSLSRSIQKLEEQVGQPLFERKPREVVLTDVGELLLERAKEILKRVEDTFSQVSEAGLSGRIRLGAIPTIAPYFLPGLLRGFAESHPNITVSVQEDTTDILLKRCSHGEIDLAILALPVIAKYLEIEPLFDEELLLVTPPDHPLAGNARITPEAVEAFPFILLNEAHCLSDNIATYCRQQSMQPVTVERLSQLATVQELVALGHGISIIPEMARRLDSSERRVYRSFSGEKPFRTLSMAWNPYRYQSKWVKSLIAHLRKSRSA
ncbi:MAG: LysR family transcriptional regulator [Verrucomicrobiales bacterium]|nr:LysR family transcriptional regulator [Verrucomicrobiales bacterium]